MKITANDLELEKMLIDELEHLGYKVKTLGAEKTASGLEVNLQLIVSDSDGNHYPALVVQDLALFYPDRKFEFTAKTLLEVEIKVIDQTDP